MLILLSPSKTTQFEAPVKIPAQTLPLFLKEASELVAVLKKQSPEDLAKILKISPALASKSAFYFAGWKAKTHLQLGRSAFDAFKGDVYDGFKAWELNTADIDFAQRHIRIFSGLYGLLRPLDAIQGYRLEMATQMQQLGLPGLYSFWQEKITRAVKSELRAMGCKVIINLASDEYAKALNLKATGAKVISPVFREFRNGKFTFVSYNGKRARGLMARFIIDNRLTNHHDLLHFQSEGYEFLESHSEKLRPYFAR